MYCNKSTVLRCHHGMSCARFIAHTGHAPKVCRRGMVVKNWWSDVFCTGSSKVGTRIDWGVDIGLRLPLLCFPIGMPAAGFHIQSVPGETAENLRWRHVHEVAPVAATCKFWNACGIRGVTDCYFLCCITNCLSYCCLLNCILILGSLTASKEIPQEEELLGDRISLIEQVEFQCRARGLLGPQPNAWFQTA